MLIIKRKVTGGLLIILILLLTGVDGFTQISINSPYSRYGMGELAMRKATYYFSMGGVANAIGSASYVNPYNPASNAAFDTLSFVFTGGMVSKFGTLKTTDLSNTNNSASLGYLLFGFPINRRIKASIGLMPYSDVGYKVVSRSNIPEVGNTDFYFEGAGGANDFYLSASYKLHKNLAIGIKGAYMFGLLEQIKAVFFPDSVGYINTRIDNQTELGGFYFDFGMQYNKLLHNGMTLGLGAIYSPSQNVSATQNYLARSYFATALGVESFRDTIESRIGDKGSVTIPEKYGLGISLKSRDKWLIAADVNWQNWRNFKYFDVMDSLQNSFQVSIGGEFLPSERSIDTYWKRVKYRFGFRYHQTYLSLSDNSINEFGITFGMGLPIPRSLSLVNVGVEVGRGGTTASDLIQENFIKINLGISVWERWFVKRRYY
jgi:hypothetical protein